MSCGRWHLVAVVAVALAAFGVSAASAQSRNGLGAYPPGMSGGQVPLGAYPSNRPPSVPSPAPDPSPPPVVTDNKTDYCVRNPAVCNVREPDTHDYSVDRQKAFQERMRAIELETGRGGGRQ